MAGPSEAPAVPKLWRLALGFLLAPLVPAALLPGILYGEPLAIVEGGYIVVAGLFFAYPPALLLGVPAYLLLRRRVRPSAVAVAIVGGLVAALPWLALGLLRLVSSNPDPAWVGNCQTVLDGERTWCGYLEILKGTAQVTALGFGLGLIGGLTFWFCVYWRSSGPAGAAPR